MVNVVTKVIYDVKDAIKNLSKLDKKVEESGSKAKSGFGKGSRASEVFNTILGKLPSSAGKVVSGLSKVTTATGAMAAGIAAAGIAVGSLASQFLDLPALLRDSALEMDAFNRATKRVFESRNALSRIGDEIAIAEAKRIFRAIKQRTAEITLEQASSQVKQEALKTELATAKGILRQRDATVKASVRTREGLEVRLAQRLADRQVSKFAGLDPGIQAARILDEASFQARKGNLDIAEDLVSQAKALSGEIKNQNFFLRDLNNANLAIDDAFKRQINSQKSIQAAQRPGLEGLRERTSELQKQLALVSKQVRLLAIQKLKLSGQRSLAREESRRDIASRGRDEAVRGLEMVAANLRRELTRGGRSVRENIIDSFKQASNNLKKSGLTTEAQKLIGEAQRILLQSAPLLEKLAAGTATRQDFEELSKLSVPLAKLQGVLEVQIAQNKLRGFKVDVDQLERLNTNFLSLAEFVRQFVQHDSAADTKLVEGVEAPFDTFNQRVKESADATIEGTVAAQELSIQANAAATHLKQIANLSVAAATPALAATAELTPAAPLTTVAPQVVEVNVNATVQGGVISPEVVEQITDIIDREIRKATTSGVR